MILKKKEGRNIRGTRAGGAQVKGVMTVVRPSGCSHRERMRVSSTTERSEGLGESNFYLPGCPPPLCKVLRLQIDEGTSAHSKLRAPWSLMASLCPLFSQPRTKNHRDLRENTPMNVIMG